MFASQLVGYSFRFSSIKLKGKKGHGHIISIARLPCRTNNGLQNYGDSTMSSLSAYSLCSLMPPRLS
jgi:hypothetical protein